MPFNYPKCGNSYCAEHRVPETHRCPGLAVSPATAIIRESRVEAVVPVSPLQSGAYWVQSSLTESFHLAAAMAATFLVLALRPLYYSGIKETTSILMILLLATISAFVVRVFAAKLISQRYGMWTEFRIDRTGLFVSLLTASPSFPSEYLCLEGFSSSEQEGRG